jgi:hypothetical protein
MNKSCSIFFYEGWLSVAPTVMNLSTLLSTNGYKVVIYTRDTNYPKIAHLDRNIEVVYFQKYPLVERFAKLLLKLKLGSCIQTLQLLIYAIQILCYQCQHRSIESGRSIKIGIDTNGGILALLTAFFTNSQSIYLSLELNNEKYFRYFDKWRIIFDRLAYRRSDAVIVQDEDRFRVLCQYARWEHPKVFYVPNSLSADYLDTRSTGSTYLNFFRDKFDLSPAQYPCLILQAGLINDLVFSKELASAFNSIDRSVALIFHERERRDWNEPFIQMLRSVNSNNLVLSLEPLPYDRIDLVFSAATIGLAFYRGIDDNFARIAKASGKLSGYLKHGKPVLIGNLDSLKQLNDRYQFGIVIANPTSSSEIERAIDSIVSNYSFYSQNALMCYQQEFEFNIQSGALLKFITDR